MLLLIFLKEKYFSAFYRKRDLSVTPLAIHVYFSFSPSPRKMPAYESKVRRFTKGTKYCADNSLGTVNVTKELSFRK